MAGTLRATAALLGLLSLPQTAGAQAPQPLTVALSNYAYTPTNLVLKTGMSYRLHLANDSSKGHDFKAPEFFAAATVDGADKAKIHDGGVEVASHQSVDLVLTPSRAGTYPLTCSHFMHADLGMVGQITVQ